MIDAVLSYHLNPNTCGVAKFNQQLARKLGVPCLSLDYREANHPLYSIKPSEISDEFTIDYPHFSIFLHGEFPASADDRLYSVPTIIYAANRIIADAVRPRRPDVIEAFCPSTLDGNPTRGAYKVLTFGMAHKLVLSHFEKLKAQLDAEHPDYTISLSTAVHEGSPWDQALTESADAMRAIFGDKLRVLGFLGDDALAKELQDCDAVAAYFTPALRANNTSAWAALEAGKPLYTNTDADSPINADSPKEGAPAPTWDALVRLLNAA